MIFHENCLPADDSHEIPCLICYFLKKWQNLKLSSAALYGLNILAIMHAYKSIDCVVGPWNFSFLFFKGLSVLMLYFPVNNSSVI